MAELLSDFLRLAATKRFDAFGWNCCEMAFAWVAAARGEAYAPGTLTRALATRVKHTPGGVPAAEWAWPLHAARAARDAGLAPQAGIERAGDVALIRVRPVATETGLLLAAIWTGRHWAVPGRVRGVDTIAAEVARPLRVWGVACRC